MRDRLTGDTSCGKVAEALFRQIGAASFLSAIFGQAVSGVSSSYSTGICPASFWSATPNNCAGSPSDTNPDLAPLAKAAGSVESMFSGRISMLVISRIPDNSGAMGDRLNKILPCWSTTPWRRRCALPITLCSFPGEGALSFLSRMSPKNRLLKHRKGSWPGRPFRGPDAWHCLPRGIFLGDRPLQRIDKGGMEHVVERLRVPSEGV